MTQKYYVTATAESARWYLEWEFGQEVAARRLDGTHAIFGTFKQFARLRDANALADRIRMAIFWKQGRRRRIRRFTDPIFPEGHRAQAPGNAARGRTHICELNA